MQSPNPADLLDAGQRFGNYVIRECIGRGGMARVYRAEHVGLGKVVALKVMDRERVDDPQWRARFVREAKSAAVVKHPHIVDVTDVGVEGALPFLVMEYLEGVDLAGHLAATGPISEATMADLLLPIIAGLGFAHDAGVVHRDIKPSNIFLSRSPDGSVVPKLLDFGIAKSVGLSDERALHTDTNQIIGTPMFMAPEALDGARFLTERSDQYALGLVMYQCVTGRSPFDEETPASLLRAVATGRLRPLRSLRPGLSRTVERLIGRALELEPSRRFSHVREMGSILFTLASRRSRVLWESAFGPGASDAGGGRWAARWAPRPAAWLGPRVAHGVMGPPAPRRATALVASGLVLGIAVAVVVALRLRRPAETPVVRVPAPAVVALPGNSPVALESEVAAIRPLPGAAREERAATANVAPIAEGAAGAAGTPPRAPSVASGTQAPAAAPATRARTRPPAARRPPSPASARPERAAAGAASDVDAAPGREQTELRELFPGIGQRSSAGGASGLPIPE